MQPASEIPSHWTPEQRTALRRFEHVTAWSGIPDGYHVAGRSIRSRADFVAAVSELDVDALTLTIEDLRARCQQADDERERYRNFDPMAALNAERAEEARLVAEFRASTPGRLERMIELLESIDARLSGAGQ